MLVSRLQQDWMRKLIQKASINMLYILKTARSYAFPALLLLSIVFGGLTGGYLGEKAHCLKPLGDILLHLIFTAIVPLVFFSVSAAIARSHSIKKLRKITGCMILVFMIMGIIAALYSLIIVKTFPPAHGIHLSLADTQKTTKPLLSSEWAEVFTVPEFSQLLSHQHILALIIFSFLVGYATALSKDKGNALNAFLQSGEAVFMKIFSLIMYYAPIGFFAYFAVTVSELGPQLIENYFRIAVTYYVSCTAYFILAYTLFAYWSGQSKTVILFWKNIIVPMMTALGTCSSAASIPANLAAAKKMNVSPQVAETIIPVGTIIHKDGSTMGGIFKIAFLFGIFQLDFSGASVILPALGIALLVGTVMGAIPSGGMLGELLILNLYGFPPSALIPIAAISIIIDPLATMLNVTGNSISSLIISRLVEGIPNHSTCEYQTETVEN